MRKRPISDVVGDVFAGLSSLVKTETALAQAEFSETIDKAIRNIITLVVGALLLLPAAVLLLEGLALAVTRAGIPEHLSYLLVAVVVAAIGVVLALSAAKRLRKTSLVPRKTIHQLQRDVEVAKHMRQDHEAERAA